ncbi:GCN5-related N-acetyltransferase [Thermobaculum terrenum ATCC BAA-798]|uniref:GCN5-related N-acetyltransferase n=1 Tax=Thermobaculum terrenum (strain ATCC BAA-798 / CCMEE 7001 / YNP1) TaxID=525904 RepID=D1CI89_THET1|nr:GNAT family N-acetyltransferase [Thermobaculum terrenum]ACZ43460.1 GCN5-related N-acetyltransferase [Thermobaculum terrenum ATCC BAA-798]
MDKAYISVRPYRATDEEALLRVWNSALVVDPINPATWRSKVLLDPNFDPEGCLVAECEGQLRGFVLSLRRRVPFFNDGLQPEQAWITAFGVEPDWQGRGIGRRLLDEALQRLRSLGARTVAISPYVPNYFTPGVDVHAYGRAVEWLLRDSWEVVERPLSMRAELTGFQIPAHIQEVEERLRGEGVVVREVEPGDIVPVLAFVQQHFTWDWHREASGVLGDLFAGDPRTVGMVVAFLEEEVVGYAQHRAERFGPFGVNPDLRSRGIGRVLLAHMLLEMRKKGYHAAWFLWTGDYAAKLYSQCGFHEVRRFAVLKKDL